MSFLSALAPLLFLLIPLPVGVDRRARHIPWITYTLVSANVLLYVATILASRGQGLSSFSFGHDLIYGPSDTNIFRVWGLVPGAPHAYAVLTSQFIHVNLGHLFWNMLFLWLFGPHVEESLGRASFTALYVGGGIAAALLHLAISLLLIPRGVPLFDPLVGASGAISAILAPYAVRFHRSQIRLIWLPGLLARSAWAWLEVPAVAGLAIWLLQNLGGAIKSAILPESGGTAYWAHMGGFAFGLVAAELTHLFREGRQEYLLQEAQSLASHSPEGLPAILAKYRAVLDHAPDNATVRAELACVLMRRTGDAQEEQENRQQAALEMTTAVRLLQKQGKEIEAVGCCAEARDLNLQLPLSSRERLRLAGAAEEQGDGETAIWLLRALIAGTPDAPEDEMARLKLGRLLLEADPAAAQNVLQSLLDRYPESHWTRRVHELTAVAARQQTNV